MRLGDGFPDSKGRSQTVSVTKADLITIIADKLKFPWARAELLVDVVFGCLEQSTSRGEKIEICATRPNYPLYPGSLEHRQPGHTRIAAPQTHDRVQTLMLLWRRGIILFHDIHAKAGVTLPELIDTAKKAGVTWQSCAKLAASKP